MSRIGHNFPPAEELPIPSGVQPGPGWTAQMLEMAAHIGPFLTLKIVERYGGQHLYIAMDPDRNVLRGLIGGEAAATMSRIYGREELQIPVARHALSRARRHPILAAARAGEISASEAGRRLRTSRTYIAYLLNDTDEGTDAAPGAPIDEAAAAAHAAQLALFGEDD
jgi:hypothetical protein